MKRVEAACICQTLHFKLKDVMPYEEALKLSTQEAEHYKQQLIRQRIQHRIVDEQVQSDGTIILKVIKQYNACPVGDYLD